MTNNVVYSANGEDDWQEDFCYVIDELSIGDMIYEGTASQPDITNLVDADDIIQMLQERAYDNYGEFTDGFADFSKNCEEYKQLDMMLKAWLSSVPVNFWTVHNITKRELTQEDFE